MAELLRAEHLTKRFVARRNSFGRPTAWVQALDDVSFDVMSGETLALVGESGSGKSTLGRVVLKLLPADAGSIWFEDEDITNFSEKASRQWRRRAQMVFQDPYASLDPRMSIGRAVGEPLMTHERMKAAERRDRVADLLERVGLSSDVMERMPYQFSGGQLQRVAIARAIATQPDFVVCDEPVAALDMSIRADVINLLRDLQRERNIGYLFISHDLSLVRAIAHRILVMYHGRVVEAGDVASLFAHPRHPYTAALLDAVLLPDPSRQRARRRDTRVVRTELATHGCAYASRCPNADELCSTVAPELNTTDGGQQVACHHPNTPVSIGN